MGGNCRRSCTCHHRSQCSACLDALRVPQQGATSCENLSDVDDSDNGPSPAVDAEHGSVVDAPVPPQALSRSKLVTTLTVSPFALPLPAGAQQSAGRPRHPASAPRAPGREELPQSPEPQRPACLSAAAPANPRSQPSLLEHAKVKTQSSVHPVAVSKPSQFSCFPSLFVPRFRAIVSSSSSRRLR